MRVKVNGAVIILMMLILAAMAIALTGCPAETPDEAENGDENAAIVQGDTETEEIREPQASEEITQPEGEEEMETTDETEAVEESGDSEDIEDATDEDEEADEEEGDDDEFEPTQEEPLAPPAQEAVGVSEVEPGNLSLVMSANGVSDPVPLEDDTTIQVDDALDIQVSIVNTLEDTVTINFMTSQKLDVSLIDENGDSVYRWSQGRRFAQIVNSLELTSGEVWSHEVTVPIGEGPGMVPPGIYSVTVMITGQPSLGSFARSVMLIR